MDTELTVDQIISDEIKEYRVIQKSNTQSVSDLIKSSAKKLADSGVIEQNQISRVLKSRFSDHKRWVEKVLPDEYKLTTKPKQEDEPKTELQELLYLSKELYKEKVDIATKIYYLLKHEEGFEKTVDTNKERIVRSIEEVKSEFAEIEIMKKQIDKRELLHSFNKVIVRKMALENTLHHVSSKFDQSAKWIKHINEDSKLTKLLEEINHCPSCGWEMSKWFDLQNQRIMKGLPVQQPKGHGKKF
ncbi:hypothetical protein N9988_00440 [bacterium]|nr:hypothetical protein [bacterium]